MKLTKLNINLQPSWSDNAGKYEAEIEYADKTGNVKLLLDANVSEAILICIGDTITKFATAAAKSIEGNIIASVEASKQINDEQPVIQQ